MQLLCNGVVLDLYDNAGLQFTHSNPLFSFDELKCERTTNFKLPATPTNDRVFSLAKIPAYSGEGMRRKFTCQLQAGTVVRDGYLYVANFDGKDYNAVFVTGELVGLQRIKELGTLRYLMPNTSTPQWLTTPKNANVSGISNMDTVKYYVQGEDVVNPCVRLFDILKDVLTREQISFDLSNVTKLDLMYIRGGKITVENINDSLVNEPSSSQDPINLRHILGLTKKTNAVSGLGECTAYNDDGQRLSWRSSQDIQYQQYQQLSFPWDAVLEFGKDCPDNLYLITGDMFAMYRSGDGYYYFAPKPIKFLGDYSFEISGFGIETAGVPLAGRKVSIPANMPFALITANGLKLPEPSAIGETAVVGFDAFAVPAYDFEVLVSLDHNFVPGENVPLKACVPDVSIISALKLFAAQEGLVLNYSDGKIILEKNIIPESSDEVRSLTKIGEVVRTFGNYAQRNIVEFDSDIPEYMKIRTEYDIINDNIDPQKELEQIVFSEGEQKQHAIGDNIYDDFLMPEGADGDFVAYLSTGTNNEYMQRVQIEKNADIQNLCDRSTQIKIEAHMPLLQYDAIKPKTGLLVDGSAYLWTERSWQKDVAKMTLAQFGKAIVQPEIPSYIQDGLVFWLDAEDWDGGSTWVDKKNGYVFQNNGVTKVNNYAYFGGSQSLNCNANAPGTLHAQGTIEVVFQQDPLKEFQNQVIYRPDFQIENFCFAWNNYKGLQNALWFRNAGNMAHTLIYDFNTASEKKVISANNDIIYQNLISQQLILQGSYLSYNGTNKTWIGQKGNGQYYKGKLYCIRIYNRKLTGDEILHNQGVDNARFNLGL